MKTVILRTRKRPKSDELDITALAHNAASQAEHVVRKMIQAGWSVCHFRNLPAWLQDNDFLIFGHRPPLPSFRACFKSIFRLHTETANIWTHLLGCVAFIGMSSGSLEDRLRLLSSCVIQR
ncbi:hypothetical protein GEV33_002169 [Tenebrio molitor]|uniref:Uncharacterized protein n=1 Tax=Tenebrio molitor TaxID=7067 RepID=A0A8J6HU14_TENMO|nr:hypothetical protein GEV33_002169 [Tenebrio molitor]